MLKLNICINSFFISFASLVFFFVWCECGETVGTGPTVRATYTRVLFSIFYLFLFSNDVSQGPQGVSDYLISLTVKTVKVSTFLADTDLQHCKHHPSLYKGNHDFSK